MLSTWTGHRFNTIEGLRGIRVLELDTPVMVV